MSIIESRESRLADIDQMPEPMAAARSEELATYVRARLHGVWTPTVTETEQGTRTTYAPPAGTPARWSTQAPDLSALPQTETIVTRSRKGRTSFKPVGPRPSHKRTTGSPVFASDDGRVQVLPACLNADEHVPTCLCGHSEDQLVAAADMLMSDDAATFDYVEANELLTIMDGLILDDDQRTRAFAAIMAECVIERDDTRLIGPKVTHPEVIFGDRSDSSPITLRNNDGAQYFGIDLVGYRAAISRDEGTHLSWRDRTAVKSENRLQTSRGHARANVAILHAEVNEATGRNRRVVLGRVINGRSCIVGMADAGYFVGHGPLVPMPAKSVRRHAERVEARERREAITCRIVRLATQHGRHATRQGETDHPAPFRGALATTVAQQSDTIEELRAMVIGQTIRGLTMLAPGRWTTASGALIKTTARAARHLARTA